VEAWKKKYGRQPLFTEADNYVAAQALFAAVEGLAPQMSPRSRGACGHQLRQHLRSGTMIANGQLQRPTDVAQVVKDEDGIGG